MYTTVGFENENQGYESEWEAAKENNVTEKIFAQKFFFLNE